MDSLWSDAEAAETVARYGGEGVGEDLALRTYSARLLGAEPRLVQHGGGNTSVKTLDRDVLGEAVEVLCVKGSGWDLATIEPAGHPAVRMDSLLSLRRVNALSDEAMVNAQRAALLDSGAPNPSVEALLHAWIPHKFVDHTHANAVLALTDQPDGEAICREVFGDRVAIAPYRMPGFSLARLAAEVFEANPKAEGMVLLKHGIFSWGATARQAYERMIEFVSMAEARIAAAPAHAFAQGRLPAAISCAAEVAPVIRGLLARELPDGRFQRMVLEHRDSPRVMDFVGGADIGRYALAGVATPDHVLRIKPWPLVLPAAETGEAFRAAAQAAFADYARRYGDYFSRWNGALETPKTPLDPLPRVVLVPGVGLFGVGATAKDAATAADIAQTNVEVISDAERIGRFESIGENDIFDVEYWSLEQAKLGKAKAKPLAGHVVAVTGGGGGIGAAIAAGFAAEGADVCVLDRDAAAAERVAASVKGHAVACDVTDAADIARAFDSIARCYGGLDILVSNAGAAWTGPIGEVDETTLRQSFELNFFAHQRAAQAALAIFRLQRTGGVLLFNVSKQALNPGPGFGPYGLPKAATLALMRQYAIDHGAEGVRANAVNADRIRSGLLTNDMIKTRSRARGLSEQDYMGGNLLGREVTADDVAKAFVVLATAQKTTGAVLTVDGGNIAAAPR